MSTVFSKDLLFVHHPKAGGSSVAHYLMRVLPPPIYYVRRTPLAGAGQPGVTHIPGEGHDTLAGARALLEQHGLSLEKIPVILAVLRNPYDMAVSLYSWFQSAKEPVLEGSLPREAAKTGSFADFLLAAFPFPPGVFTDSYAYFHENGQMPDMLRIVRFDDIENGVRAALMEIGIDSEERMPSLNASLHADYRMYYDRETENVIYAANRWMFEEGFFARMTLPSDRAVGRQTGLGRLARPDWLAPRQDGAFHARPGEIPTDMRASTVAAKTAPFLDASPNPVPAGSGSGTTTVHWSSGDRDSQVWVRTGEDDETLFADGGSGRQVAPWIQPGVTYEFRLCEGEQRERVLAAITVVGIADDRGMITEAADADDPPNDETRLSVARLLAKVLQPYSHSPLYEKHFELWQANGFHLIPAHYYFPIPNTAALPSSLWDRPSELVGIDMNDAAQLRLLKEEFPRFRAEYDQFPTAATNEPHVFHFDNDLFGGTDALALYCMIRHFEPGRVLEVGSGFSSRLSAQALRQNGRGDLICIEPYPDAVLRDGFPGLTSLIVRPVQEVGLAPFLELDAGDILFIDTSHIVKTGSDVNYLFLQVLPRLRPGVIVHVHDIFLPREYPEEWVRERYRFWNEQYLLQAFLAFNTQYEVLFANNYLSGRYAEEMKASFPCSPWWGGGSFWIRRKLG